MAQSQERGSEMRKRKAPAYQEICLPNGDSLQKFFDDVTLIKHALLGTEYDKTGGLIYKVDQNIEKTCKNTADIAQMKLNWKLITWVSGGVAGLITLIIRPVLDLFISIFNGR